MAFATLWSVCRCGVGLWLAISVVLALKRHRSVVCMTCTITHRCSWRLHSVQSSRNRLIFIVGGLAYWSWRRRRRKGVLPLLLLHDCLPGSWWMMLIGQAAATKFLRIAYTHRTRRSCCASEKKTAGLLGTSEKYRSGDNRHAKIYVCSSDDSMKNEFLCYKISPRKSWLFNRMLRDFMSVLLMFSERLCLVRRWDNRHCSQRCC